MTKGPRNPERSFGVSVGLVLCAIAALLLWRNRVGRAEIVGGVGLVLLACGLVHPPLLKWPSGVWWRFSRALGYVNVRILLSILFFFVLTPLSIVWRLAGKDPLARRRDRWPGWSPYPARYRDHKHYWRMY
jgi:hypothetical protein